MRPLRPDTLGGRHRQLASKVTDERHKPNLPGFWVYLGDFVAVGDPGNDPPDTSPSSPEYENGSTYAGPPYDYPAFRHGLDGDLEFKGVPTDVVFGDVLTTLPTEWRPEKDETHYHDVLVNGELVPARWVVDASSGEVTLYEIANSNLPYGKRENLRKGGTGFSASGHTWLDGRDDHRWGGGQFLTAVCGWPEHFADFSEDPDELDRGGIEILQGGLFLINVNGYVHFDEDSLSRSPTNEIWIWFGWANDIYDEDDVLTNNNWEFYWQPTKLTSDLATILAESHPPPPNPDSFTLEFHHTMTYHLPGSNDLSPSKSVVFPAAYALPLVDEETAYDSSAEITIVRLSCDAETIPS